MNALLRIDTKDVFPADFRAYRATLELYVEGRSNPASLYLDIYPLTRPFAAEQATWEKATAGTVAATRR